MLVDRAPRVARLLSHTSNTMLLRALHRAAGAKRSVLPGAALEVLKFGGWLQTFLLQALTPWQELR